MHLLLAFAAAAQADARPAVTLPEPSVLTEQIAARDSEFFRLFFEGCDPGGYGR